MEEWSISKAKEKFNQVVSLSEDSPQIICNGDRPVSAVIHIDLFRELMALREKKKKPTIAELLDGLQITRESEPLDIEIPERRDRAHIIIS